MKIKSMFFISALAVAIVSCNGNGEKADAYGNFETDEVTVSSEATGRLLKFSVDEGESLKEGVIVGLVDTSQIVLKRKQVAAQINAAASRLPNIVAQADVQREQIRILEVDHERFKNMLADGAATQKQLDDVEGRISLANKQIDAIETQRKSVVAEIDVLKTQLVQIDDQLQRCRVVNPVAGTVLVRFAQQGEIVAMGKPLYKIANMDFLYLKVFVTGDQLSSFAIGEKMNVFVDGENGELLEKEGTVSWVSSSAEFTPKIIQTRDERVKMVYAVKVKVKNDGDLKIGMPGEVFLKKQVVE
ncbi:MAG TPA: HlyD family efflux transporter periplasmic adaptor subunit [Tenuifilaceae bacterium]|nr:HlyD family efflux transporter periplasmic adaptor subunit [Tenuifilaceae bacterium]